jgi:hypothetical protein
VVLPINHGKRVQENPRLTIVIWDAQNDKGYQLIGESEKVQDLAIMNGFSPDMETRPPLPTVFTLGRNKWNASLVNGETLAHT